jgi:hypothetical protein
MNTLGLRLQDREKYSEKVLCSRTFVVPNKGGRPRKDKK